MEVMEVMEVMGGEIWDPSWGGKTTAWSAGHAHWSISRKSSGPSKTVWEGIQGPLQVKVSQRPLGGSRAPSGDPRKIQRAP